MLIQVPPSNSSAWADYLESFDWGFMTTLTTRTPAAVDALSGRFERQFVRNLARTAQGPIAWFRVIERSADVAPHIHALLWSPARLSVADIGRAWGHGFSRTTVFGNARGGGEYVTKSLDRNQDADYRISSRLPPSRRG